jgi:hypothetical protein
MLNEMERNVCEYEPFRLLRSKVSNHVIPHVDSKDATQENKGKLERRLKGEEKIVYMD